MSAGTPCSSSKARFHAAAPAPPVDTSVPSMSKSRMRYGSGIRDTLWPGGNGLRAGLVLRPAKAFDARRGRERALRQARWEVRLVVGRRRHVVRPVGVEERGEQLDLPARDADLAHPAAVHPDAVALTVLVDLEQRAHVADARRLD